MSRAAPKVAFVTSHPIQYQVPVFRHLAADPELQFQVLFAQIPDAQAQGAEFGVPFQWDLPLLDGYEYEVLHNVSRTPSVMHFRGCDTPGIFERLRAGGFDAVVVNGWVVKTCLQALWACRRLGIPCLVRGEANRLRPRPAWKQWIQGNLVRRYSGYLYIGEANRAFYRHYGIPESMLFPARYCIENDRFSQAAQQVDRSAARRRWQIPDDAACYLFCGKFIPKKHPAELLEAFRTAATGDVPIHLLMVGDGELRQRCQAYASEHNLPVTFTGFLNQRQIVEAYVAADCLVLPSDHGETWGLVVNEAMACGKAAIVTDQVGCREDLIVDGVTGEWFEFGQWSRLAELMHTLAADRGRLTAMGEQAAARVADYSPQQAASGIKQGVLATVARFAQRRESRVTVPARN